MGDSWSLAARRAHGEVGFTRLEQFSPILVLVFLLPRKSVHLCFQKPCHHQGLSVRLCSRDARSLSSPLSGLGLIESPDGCCSPVCVPACYLCRPLCLLRIIPCCSFGGALGDRSLEAILEGRVSVSKVTHTHSAGCPMEGVDYPEVLFDSCPRHQQRLLCTWRVPLGLVSHPGTNP